MEKRYTVKSSGKTAEGKHIWSVYDKEQAVFLPSFVGGKFQLQDIAKHLNEGKISADPKVSELVDDNFMPFSIVVQNEQRTVEGTWTLKLLKEKIQETIDLYHEDGHINNDILEDRPEQWAEEVKELKDFQAMIGTVKTAVEDYAEWSEQELFKTMKEHGTPKTVGYMRISTTGDKQSFDRQQMQLEAMGCHKIYSDRVSGSKRDREQLNLMLEELEAGDTVLIVAIDRLSRSTKDLLEIVEIIKNKGAYLKSINDAWLNTSEDNPMSDFLLTVMGALGQMERAMIAQRVQEGVDTARAKGKQLGRPKANKSKVALALELYYGGDHTSKEICDITGLSKATLFRKVKDAENNA